MLQFTNATKNCPRATHCRGSGADFPATKILDASGDASLLGGGLPGAGRLLKFYNSENFTSRLFARRRVAGTGVVGGDGGQRWKVRMEWLTFTPSRLICCTDSFKHFQDKIKEDRNSG